MIMKTQGRVSLISRIQFFFLPGGGGPKSWMLLLKTHGVRRHTIISTNSLFNLIFLQANWEGNTGGNRLR